MSVFPRLESQNPYPQAVTLTVDLQANPDEKTWEIRATLDQQEQWLSLLSGKLKLSLRGGTLQLRGQGGTLTPNQELPPNIQQRPSSPSECQWQIRFPLALEPLALANFNPKDQTGYLAATFTITPPDLAIAESQGLWPPDLSPNQLAIADRLIAQFLVNDWFPPALSWGQWAIDADIPWQPLYTHPDAETLREKEMILGDRLQLLANTSTSDLLALAQLVGLDPQRDLAGGKFVGANLSGIDLSNAQLAGSNFRGAILTDADLNGANLT
ncbi:MAG: pentapeptide repeat-containing protein [Synechocystis sp.]